MRFLVVVIGASAFGGVYHRTRAPSLALVAGLLGVGAAQTAVIYLVNTTITSSNPTGNAAQSDAVLETITTDGAIGVLSTGSILG